MEIFGWLAFVALVTVWVLGGVIVYTLTLGLGGGPNYVSKSSALLQAVFWPFVLIWALITAYKR